MLYHLLFPLHEQFGVFNLFRYITFRAAGAAITALLICWIFGPRIIAWLRVLKFGQEVRKDGPTSHLVKQGTPTMGGILILAAIAIPTLLWAKLNNESVWILLFTTFCLGLLGFLDDYLRVVKKWKNGLQGRYKLIGQALTGMIAGLAIIYCEPFGQLSTTTLAIPFLKEKLIDLGLLYVPFVVLTITAASNSVNLADGLDGLCIGLMIPPAIAFGALAYVGGNAVFANYLNRPFLEESGELTVFASALVGAALGFLWYNAHPAIVFMGDTGSLALGGSLGMLAILVKRELLLVLVGGVFVAESLSVMIQVLSYKYRGGKRVFKMAPLHHHFELSGWKETQVVIRFWIVGILLALVTLTTVKLQ
ncbi:MAG: phospho-N-acetylmuramoyl-pentapeptide-transferase [Candidatus Eisenbacteria bacterium]|nr:phospho-N-acetylmuramoyl-pentapeptide-transferase [Candidatus Eisenbacteria bacterium]